MIYIKKKLPLFTTIVTLLLIIITFQSAKSQSYDRIEKERMKSILNNIKGDIKKNYYDSQFHGIDIEAKFEKAEERLDQVKSVDQAFSVIAQTLMDFNDSHLYFIPPATNYDVEYGFKMKIVDNKIYVTSVKPKSDAEAKGLKAGDEILMFEGFKPSRKDLWKMKYYYNVLSPKTKLRLKILRPKADAPEDIEFESKVVQKKRIINTWDSIDLNDLIRESEDSRRRKAHYFVTLSGIVIWKMNTFSYDPALTNQVMTEATKGNGLIIDLRGNGGGYVKNLETIAGYFFETDKKIAERKGREEKKKENEPMMAKSNGKKTFAGKLIILVDADSGSASEILARFIQLENRGKVLGDLSAGAVMQAIGKTNKIGADRLVLYGTSITNADVIMSDGKSLEHIGVIPDELIVPAAEDIAYRKDPVMARALALMNISLPSDKAGKIFPDDEWDN